MALIFIEFGISDLDLVAVIEKSTPPAGIKVGKPVEIFKASAADGGVFITFAIEFVSAVKDVSIGILSAWLYDCCVKGGKKKGRINRDQIVFNKSNIRRIVKKELASQNRRDAQRRNDKNRPAKKCS